MMGVERKLGGLYKNSTLSNAERLIVSLVMYFDTEVALVKWKDR